MMTSRFSTRVARTATALAMAVPLATSVAVVTPVAAVGPSVLCVAAAPNVWVIPLTSARLTFAFGEAKTFRVYIRNNMACGLPWRVSSVTTSRSGYVWTDVPAGPTSGTVPGWSTDTTSFVVTAPPFYSPSADVYITVRTSVSGPGSPGFHWTVGMTD